MDSPTAPITKAACDHEQPCFAIGRADVRMAVVVSVQPSDTDKPGFSGSIPSDFETNVINNALEL